MANVRANVNAMEKLIKDLDTLTIDKLAPDMLKKAGEILLEEVQDKVRPHRATGSLAGSIRLGNPKRVKDGYSISVAPHGRDANGMRNMEKLAYLEYGTGAKGKRGGPQRATPVLFPAVMAARSRCEDVMQKTFEKACDKI